MTGIKNFFSFLVERFKNPRSFYYPQEQLAFQRRQEQMLIQNYDSAYFSCRHLRD